MKAQTFVEYIQNPAQINAEVGAELQKIVGKYPYFYAAQTLFLKYLKQTNKSVFEEELQKRSVFINNKSILDDFLAKEFFVETVAETETEAESEEEMLTFENEMIPFENPQAEQIEEPAESEANETVQEEKEEEFLFELTESPQNATDDDDIQITFETEKPANSEEPLAFEIEEEEEPQQEPLPEEIQVEEPQQEPLPEENQTEEATPIVEFTEKQTEAEEVKELAETPNEPIAPEKPLSLAETILLRIQQMKENKTQSFSETEVESKSVEEEKKTLQEEQQSIVDKFLSYDEVPQISVENMSENQFDKSERSVQEGEYVTETMAKIYVQQKKNSKAIKIYEQLALQFPQKSVYFAQKISELQ